MARKKKSSEELVEASEHVCYEIWMMHHMGRSLSTGLAGQGPIHNSFINSFAVHVRNLIEFLYESKGESKSDAILAEDYFDTATDWTSMRPKQSIELKKAKIRCEKQVAHLTYTRDQKEPWDFVRIVRALHEPLSFFMENVNQSLLGQHIRPIEHLFPKK